MGTDACCLVRCFYGRCKGRQKKRNVLASKKNAGFEIRNSGFCRSWFINDLCKVYIVNLSRLRVLIYKVKMVIPELWNVAQCRWDMGKTLRFCPQHHRRLKKTYQSGQPPGQGEDLVLGGKRGNVIKQ